MRDFTVPVAFAGILLVASDGPLAWALKQAVPGLGPALDSMSRGTRILCFGLPSAAAFAGLLFLLERRTGRPSIANAFPGTVVFEAADVQPVHDKLRELRRIERPIPRADVAEGDPGGRPPDAVGVDANRLVQVFHGLLLEPGRRLDYVVESGDEGGRALLYTRMAKAKALLDAAEYRRRFPRADSEPPHLHGVACAAYGTGILHFAWFALEAPHFFLPGNAKEGRFEVVPTRRRLEEIAASIPEEARRRALELDVRPVVTVEKGAAEVSLVGFSEGDGFVAHTIRIAAPCRLVGMKRETRVAYRSPG